MPIRENIIKLRSIYGLTQEELAKVADVTRGAVSQWEGGFSEPRMGAIQKIADHFGLSKMNIIEEGGMDCIDPMTKKPYDPLPPGAIIPVIEATAYAPLRGRVHAGDAQPPEVLEEVVIALPDSIASLHPAAFFLEVEGDCMNRVYPEGCLILIDPHLEPRNGSIAAVSIDGADYVMRRYYRTSSTLVLSPESFNPDHQDIVITDPETHTVEMVGTVVWFQTAEEMR